MHSGVGGGRREVLNTTQNKEPGRRKRRRVVGWGCWMPDHSITFLFHFYSGIGKESQKKECKREEIRLS